MSVVLSPAALQARKELLAFLAPRMSRAELRKTSKLIAAFVAGVLRSRPAAVDRTDPLHGLTKLVDVFFNGRESK